MRASSFGILAFAAAALAQTEGFDALTSPPTQAKYNIGDTLPIAWTPSTPAGKITLTLIGGPTASDLAPITVIAASIDSTLATYSWPIPSTVGSLASYGVNLTRDGGSDFQYSNQFFISGGSSSSSSSSPSSGSTTTLVSTTQSTATITVPSSSSGTPTPSGGLLSSKSFSNSTMTSASKTTSKSSSASATGSASSSSSPSPTSGADALRLGSVVGLGGAVMALLL